MHICLDARTVNDHFPGIGRYTYNLARALVPLMCASDQLTLLHDPTPASQWNLDLLGRREVCLVDVPLSPISLRQQWRLPALLRKLQPDLYHSPYYLMPWYTACPSVVTIFDLIPWHDGRGFSATRRLAYRVAMRLSVRAARLVLTASQAAARDLQSILHVPAERIVVIPAAADRIFEPQTAAQVDAVRGRLGVLEPYVLAVGTNKPHKNLVRLIEAWARIQPQPFSLVLAGLWNARYPESRQRVAALGLERAVRFLGPVAEADLPGLYSGAALVVLPSEQEGFGFPAVEAMACGVPVACANAPGVSEVVREAAALFEPRNVDAIASTLAELLADPARRVDLAERSRRRSAELSWEDCAHATLAAYRQALA